MTPDMKNSSMVSGSRLSDARERKVDLAPSLRHGMREGVVAMLIVTMTLPARRNSGAK